MQTNAFSFLFIRWKIQCLFVTKNALPLQSLKKQRKQIYEYYYSK